MAVQCVGIRPPIRDGAVLVGDHRFWKYKPLHCSRGRQDAQFLTFGHKDLVEKAWPLQPTGAQMRHASPIQKDDDRVCSGPDGRAQVGRALPIHG